jgi:glutamyl/glutaminyl-tRNA synthetase
VIKSNAQFNPEKLLWVNGQHIRALSGEVYESQITAFWKDKVDPIAEGKWRKLIALYRPRIQTYGDLQDQAAYCFTEPEYKDAQLTGEIKDSASTIGLLNRLRDVLSELGDFEDIQILDQKTKQVSENAGLKPKDIIHPLRFVLTGGTASPGIFELMSLLGKETCLRRLQRFLS